MDCFNCLHYDCTDNRPITREEVAAIKQAFAVKPIRERNRAYKKWLHRFGFSKKELAAITKYAARLEDSVITPWMNYSRMDARDLRNLGVNYERETL